MEKRIGIFCRLLGHQHLQHQGTEPSIHMTTSKAGSLLRKWWWWCYQTPSKGWGHGGTPWPGSECGSLGGPGVGGINQFFSEFFIFL